MILRAIPAVEGMKDISRSQNRMGDLILQLKVEAVLLNANPRNIRIEVTGGVVTLYGTVSSGWEGSSYVSMVSGIEGVQKVNNSIVILAKSRMREG